MELYLRYTRTYRSIVNDDKVILVNRDTGQWMRISKECFDILNDAISNRYMASSLLETFQDPEDREYFEKLLKNAMEMGVISENEGNSKKIETIYLILTNRCNLKCKHCCVSAEGVNNKIIDNEMNTDAFKNAIDKVAACNPDRVIVSGGEPMIRKDFLELMQYLRNKYSGIIGLSTNAVLINRTNVKDVIKNVDRIDISIDGVDEETCSIVRGRGVFDKVISTIHLLKSEGFNEIYLSMIFGDFNEGLQDQFKELNKRLGTNPVIRGFVPIGRGKTNETIFMNTEKDIVPEITYTPEEIRQARKGIIGIRCGAGLTDFVINYDGDVYPCANLLQSYYKLFNIQEIISIQNFVDEKLETCKGYEILNEIQPEHYVKCKKCKVNLFCWSCLQDIENLKNNDKCFEERCRMKKKILFPILWGDEVI